jgi:hypothetical protein
VIRAFLAAGARTIVPDLLRRMHFFKRASPRIIEPAITSASDLEAEAHAGMKAAEIACKIAKDALFLHECRSRTYGLKILPDQSAGSQLDTDPERLRLAAQAARLNDDFQRRTEIWSDLKRKNSTNESRHVAGELVKP